MKEEEKKYSCILLNSREGNSEETISSLRMTKETKCKTLKEFPNSQR